MTTQLKPNPKRDAALEIARLGDPWRVHPVHVVKSGKCTCGKVNCDKPGKHPILTGWQRLATRDEAIINQWWEQIPDANVGIPTDEIVVLDVDPRHGGDISLAELERKHGALPHTVESLTGGGGCHKFFLKPKGVRIGNKVALAPGLDVRGEGGQVVAPGSIHESGRRYEWEVSSHPADVSLASIPQWLIDLIIAPSSNGSNADSAHKIRVKITEGRRNDALFRYGCFLRGRTGASEAEIYAALAVRNAEQCDPALDDEEVRKIAESAARYEGGAAAWNGNDTAHEEDSDTPKSKAERRSAADRLIGYALSDPKQTLLFVDQHGAPHALINGQPVRLNSRCYSWLRRLMWEHEKRTAGGEALSQAAGTLAALAEASGEVRELHVRSAWHNDTLYVELDAERVLRVDANGWQLDSNPPVLFRRFPNLKPLPTPERGGSLQGLLDLLPLRSERDKRLLKVYMVCGLLPHVPRPIKQTTGEMGSGKTTLHRILKRLLDPTTPETIRLDPRDALQKASHCAIVLCDNLSHLADWQVDTLCRLVTGEGDSKRVHYTDDDDFIYEFKRLVLLNGINPPADRPDFLDRCLCLELDRIPDGKRKPEREIWATFEREHARWLGCVFDLLSKAMRIKGTLRLASLPRLADWGEWAAAVYEAAGFEENGVKGADLFQADWGGNVENQQAAALDGSTLAQVVLSFMAERPEWTGTPSDLLTQLHEEAERLSMNTKGDRKFPQTPSWVWRRLKEVKHLLATHGVQASQPTRGKVRDITLRKVCKNADGADDADETPEGQGFSDDSTSTPNDTKPDADVNGDDEKLQKTKDFDTNDSNDGIFTECSGYTLTPDDLTLPEEGYE